MKPYTKHLFVAGCASIGIHMLVLEVWFVMVTLNLITGRTQRAIEPPKPQIPVLTVIEQRERQRPMTFVETDASQTRTPLKDARYYSNRSTQAANPKPDKSREQDQPNLTGPQNKVPSTANVALPQPVHEPPAEPPKPPIDLQKNLAPEPEQKAAPKPKENSVGPKKTELAMLTKPPETKPQTATPPKPATRTEQARLGSRPTERMIPEQMSKSDSSVSHEGARAFEVTWKPQGEYDRRLIAAVKYRWLALIEQYTIPGERAGQVSVKFHLNDNGTVSELTVEENTAGDILALYCEKAITDSAPFGPWPAELKDLVKRNYRELNFVFYY